MHSGLSGDVFWQLASGRWMLDHHQILRQDVFSYTVLGRHWLTPEWGYQVLLAAAVRQLGPVAFWLLSAGTATLTVLAVTARCRRYGAGWTWTGIIAITCGAAMAVFLKDRPEMVSYLLLAVLMLVLTLARSHRGWLVVVPLLCAIWANDHGSYVLALAVLVLELVVAAWPLRLGRLVATDPLPLRAVSLTLVASVLATLVNPEGWGIYPYTVRLTFNPAIGRLIEEWQSPDFHVLVLLVLVAGPLAVTAAYFLFSDQTVPAIDLLLAGALLVATLESVRFLPYFVVAWCGVAARCPPIPSERLRGTVATWPLVAVLGVALLAGPWVPAGQPATGLPVRAVAYLQAHRGRVFSSYRWNDYLIDKSVPVFVDGRTDLYTGTGTLSRYLDVANLTTDPDTILHRYHVAYVLWDRASPLAVYLAHDPLWRTVWHRGSVVVFASNAVAGARHGVANAAAGAHLGVATTPGAAHPGVSTPTDTAQVRASAGGRVATRSPPLRASPR